MKTLWAIIASWLWIGLIIFVPMLILAEVVVWTVKPALFEAGVLAGLFAWGILVGSIADSNRPAAKAIRKAYHRFIYPFGE